MNKRTGQFRALWLGMVCVSVLSGCAGSGPDLDADPTPTDQISLARREYTKKNLSKAETLLKGYLDFSPAGEDAGEAHFLLGMIYSKRKAWPSSATEFSIVVNQFGADLRAPDARYHLATALWAQSRPSSYDQEYTVRALDELDRFLSLYPDHPNAEDALKLRNKARSRLAKKAYDNGRLYLKLGYLNPARYYFRLVQREFADTDYAARATLLEAEAFMKEDNWEEARSILTQLLDQSPPESVASYARHLLKRVNSQSERDAEG